MALQDTITNLGTAIINLVTSKITKHSSEIEEALLELQAKIDELLGGGRGTFWRRRARFSTNFF